jgi:hypothetical protein
MPHRYRSLQKNEQHKERKIESAMGKGGAPLIIKEAPGMPRMNFIIFQ